MFLPSNMKFSYMRELLFSQLWEKTNILVSTRIAFLRRELLLGKSTKNSLNLLQTRITQRKVILVCIVRESLILVCFLGENYIKPRRELSFSLLENDNSRLNIVILPLIRGENHVIRGTITVSFISVISALVISQSMSRPCCFVTKIAGDGESFHVVCLDVLLHVNALTLFSTNFANINLSRTVLAFTFLHH